MLFPARLGPLLQEHLARFGDGADVAQASEAGRHDGDMAEGAVFHAGDLSDLPLSESTVSTLAEAGAKLETTGESFMPIFNRTYGDAVAQSRAEISRSVESAAGGVRPASVDYFLDSLKPALDVAYGVKANENVFPPSYMAAISSVVLQGATTREALQAAQDKLAAMEARYAGIVKRANRGLEGLNLPADDLLLVAYHGAQRSADARKRLDDLSRGGGTLLDRVRSKLTAGEAPRLKAEIQDFNPETEMSRVAVALSVLDAAESRRKMIFQPIEMAQRYSVDRSRAMAGEGSLLACAASMSHVYSDANQARLRGMVEASGHVVQLSVDRDEDDQSVEWLLRRKG